MLLKLSLILGLLHLLTADYPASLPTVLSVEDYEGNFKRVDILSTRENCEETMASYYLSNFQTDWQTANDSCVNLMKMNLVSIQDSTKNVEVKAAIDAGPNPDSGYWTSGKFSSSEDAFIWTASGQGFTYTDWASGNLNHNFNSHPCLYVNSFTRNFLSLNCSFSSQYFICE